MEDRIGITSSDAILLTPRCVPVRFAGSLIGNTTNMDLRLPDVKPTASPGCAGRLTSEGVIVDCS